MGACNFTIIIKESAETVINRAKDAILKAENAQFDGNASHGAFALPTPLGPVKGNYVIESDKIHFHIEEKPFLVSCNLIESKLSGFIGNNS